MPQNNISPEDHRPKLRCPVCSSMVPLPAENCNRCGANLRTGYRPEEVDDGAGRGRLILALAVLVLIIGSAVLFFVLGADDQPKAAARPSALEQGGLGEALDGLNDRPLALQPGPILDMTREKAGQVEDRWQQVEDPYPTGD